MKGPHVSSDRPAHPDSGRARPKPCSVFVRSLNEMPILRFKSRIGLTREDEGDPISDRLFAHFDFLRPALALSVSVPTGGESAADLMTM